MILFTGIEIGDLNNSIMFASFVFDVISRFGFAVLAGHHLCGRLPRFVVSRNMIVIASM